MNNPPLKALAVYQSGLTRIAKDTSLLATHISLFTAMFVCWQFNEYVTPFRVNRRQLMAFGKIASIATYHKCIKESPDICIVIGKTKASKPSTSKPFRLRQFFPHGGGSAR